MLNQSKLKSYSTFGWDLVGCLVTFAIKKIYSFPEYKISADTKHQRTNASIKLKDILSNILKSCEEKKSRDFNLHGQLQYITCFPTGGWNV